MKNKLAIQIFTIALALVCLFHISFTFKSRIVKNQAEAYAAELAGDDEDLKEAMYNQYLDSISAENVYNILVRKYSYLQVKERELNLGLDLQGGMSVTLEVSQADILKALCNLKDDPKFLKAIENANVALQNSQSDYVSLFVTAFKQVAPDAKLAAYFSNKDNKEKINFNSSDEEVAEYLRLEAEDAVERSFKIIRSRIDRFGVAQPNIQKLEQSGRILVELPGIKDVVRARKLLQSTAKLEFWKTYMSFEAYKFAEEINKALLNRNKLTNGGDTSSVDTSKSENKPLLGSATVAGENKNDTSKKSDDGLLGLGNVTDTGTSDTAQKSLEDYKKENPFIGLLYNERSFLNVNQEKGEFAQSPELAYVDARDTAKVNVLLNDPELKANIPADVIWAWHYQALDGTNNFALYALKATRDGAVLDGDVITDARSSIGSNGFEVQMYMNTEGTNQWKRITAEAAKTNPKRSIAVVLDGVIYSAPTVQNEISQGVSQITGNFTQDDTKFLANILKSGKLPAPARIAEEAIVGPSLGKEAIRSGLISIMFGFASVILIMALVYSTAGWIANAAVLLNLYFIIGVLASLQAALTLPGMAGIILTMGMAVDANVLINERVKEELKAGKNLKNAVSLGYKNALSAILDSNITTLITGFILLLLGSGPIYGFSVVLIIGILSSLFTAIIITRLINDWMLKRDKNIKFYTKATENLLINVKFDWLGKRKIYYAVSSIVILVGLVSIFTKGLSFGVDFKGGWAYTVRFTENVTTTEVREKLAVPFESAPEVKVFGTNNTLKITTSYKIDDNSVNAAEIVMGKLQEGLKDYKGFEVIGQSKVGATIADDIKQSAFLAIFVAMIFMFLYILIRFKRWQFAAGAIVGLFHDVLFVLGMFSLLDGIVPFTLEIDQAFIAAILTVIGYSINDSVVVMDRVREYLGEHKNAKNLREIINNALNSTLSRTLMTSLTTIGVLLILFVFGGEVIRGFSFAMFIGILVGTYSSLCIATPVAADLFKEDISKQA